MLLRNILLHVTRQKFILSLFLAVEFYNFNKLPKPSAKHPEHQEVNLATKRQILVKKESGR